MTAGCPAVSSPPHSLTPHTNGLESVAFTQRPQTEVLIVQEHVSYQFRFCSFGHHVPDTTYSAGDARTGHGLPSRNRQSGRVGAGTCLVPSGPLRAGSPGPPWALVFPPTLRPSVTSSKADSRTLAPLGQVSCLSSRLVDPRFPGHQDMNV